MRSGSLNFPGQGLIRTTLPEAPPINASQRAVLIRKGNELFNTGKIDEAKKLFLTTRYQDGLVRIGDYYYAQNDFISALQMYVIAPEPEKKEILVQKLSLVVQNWLTESEFV